jgi:hypothetical protein
MARNTRRFDVYEDTTLSLRNPDMGLGDLAGTRTRRASAAPSTDDEILRQLFATAPQKRTAAPTAPTAQRRAVTSARDLRGFVRVANTNKLIRISDQDFWELKQSGDGGYELRRLVDDEGNPIEE